MADFFFPEPQLRDKRDTCGNNSPLYEKQEQNMSQ